MNTLAAVLGFVLLAGCMSDAERVKQIQTEEAMYRLTLLRLDQLRARRDAATSAQVAQLISDSIATTDGWRIEHELKLAKLRR